MLSLEQQNIIENSVWVVNTALKKQGLQHNEDLRQSALLYMCGCIQKFDPSKNIKWTTYAYKNVYLHIKNLHKKEMEKQSNLISDNIYDLEPILITKENESEQKTTNLRLNSIREVCNCEENRLLDLKLLGYKHTEISKIMNCSVSKVKFCMRNIRKKAKEIEFNQ